MPRGNRLSGNKFTPSAAGAQGDRMTRASARPSHGILGLTPPQVLQGIRVI